MQPRKKEAYVTARLAVMLVCRWHPRVLKLPPPQAPLKWPLSCLAEIKQKINKQTKILKQNEHNICLNID